MKWVLVSQEKPQRVRWLREHAVGEGSVVVTRGFLRAEESGPVGRAVTSHGRVSTGERGHVKYTLERSLVSSVEKEPEGGETDAGKGRGGPNLGTGHREEIGRTASREGTHCDFPKKSQFELETEICRDWARWSRAGREGREG